MEVSAQWADTLFALERLFLLKIALWAALAVVTGTFLLLISRQRDKPRLLEGVGLGLIAPGVVEILVSLPARGGSGFRDLESATSLDRALWVTIGVAGAWASAALLFAYRERATPTQSRAPGVAIGVAAHCGAIALLALQLATALVR